MRPGAIANRYENRNCRHVHMRPVRKSHTFRFIPLACMPLLFFKGLNLSSMRCSEAESAAETGLKCICVYIYPALDSSRSEDSQLSPAGWET